MGWEHLMLQDLYDDGFIFAGVLWGEIWVFLFMEEMGLMGLGFDIVCLGFHIMILGFIFHSLF